MLFYTNAFMKSTKLIKELPTLFFSLAIYEIVWYYILNLNEKDVVIMIPKPKDFDKITIPGDIGGNIRLRRQALKMTQQELADKIGVTKAAISRYEKNLTKDISLNTKIALARALRCSPLVFANLGDETSRENKLYVQAGKDAMDMLDGLLDFMHFSNAETTPLGDVITPTKHLSTKRYIIIDKTAWDNADVKTLSAFVEFMAQRAAVKDAKLYNDQMRELNEEGDTNEKP